MKSRCLAALVAVCGFASASMAQVEITRYDFDSNIVGTPARNLSISQTPAPGVLMGARGFQVYNPDCLTPDGNMPFTLADDTSVSSCAFFMNDMLGVVARGEYLHGRFFGVVDTVDPANPSGLGIVTFEFNIAGFNNLEISIDMAAMGDFETGGTPDYYNWEYSIDGGSFFPLFTSSVNDARVDGMPVETLTYTLASGTMVTLPDPLSMTPVGGTPVFVQNAIDAMQTFTAPVTGAGSVLTLRFTTQAEATTEGFAFDNVVITGFETSDVLGACCVAGPMGNSCFQSPQASCINLGGTYGGDNSDCSEMFCPSPTGACCLPGFFCNEGFTQADCLASNGTWGGGNSTCGDITCADPTIGACCILGVACQELPSSDCALVDDAVFGGNGSTCADFCGPLGACCFDGFCYENQTQGSCESFGGVYQGAGSTCETAMDCEPDPTTCPSGLTEITRFDFDGNVVGAPSRNLSFSQNPLPGNFLPSLARGFEVWEIGVSPSIPFTLVDETLIGFPADVLGVVPETYVGAWFGVVDTVDPTNPQNFGIVEFTFDVSGFIDISVCIAMGAMGDWEVPGANGCNDVHDWTYSFNGVDFFPLFTSSVDEDATFNYTLASGKVVPLPDPLFMNGRLLQNGFNIFSAAAPGTGDTLTLRYYACTDGAQEGYAFDDIVISGVPDTAQPCPCDYNNNGLQEIGDYFTFLTAFFAQLGGPGSADFDGDGTVTIGDYFAFLGCLPAIAASTACP